MNHEKLARFEDGAAVFACPICGGSLALAGASLRCESRHCFDIARQGYVNLCMHARPSEHYSRESFVSRRAILDGGYYGHVLQALLRILEPLDDVVTLLDAGCGEGYYARRIHESLGRTMFAFDISKDSVQLAAGGDAGNAIRWFVGNLMRLPIRSGAVDGVLDVFAPANYAEFMRVLRPGGYVIKVIPGSRHLIELRELVHDQLRNQEYSNQSVKDGFAEHVPIVAQVAASHTYAMPPADVERFADMTPLLFHADRAALGLSAISELTIDAEILVGRKPC